MLIRDVMTSPVITVDQHDDLWKVYNIFEDNSFRHAVVTDLNDRVLGMISLVDLFRIVPMRPGETLESHREALAALHTQDVMQASVNFRAEDPLKSLVDVFIAHRVDAGPVVDENRHAMGIVTTVDLLRALSGMLDKG